MTTLSTNYREPHLASSTHSTESPNTRQNEPNINATIHRKDLDTTRMRLPFAVSILTILSILSACNETDGESNSQTEARVLKPSQSSEAIWSESQSELAAAAVLPEEKLTVLPEMIPNKTDELVFSSRTLVSSPLPLFPKVAQDLTNDLVISVAFSILEDGSVIDAQIVHPSGYAEIDLAVINAVRLWKYSASEGSQPIKANVRIVVRGSKD